MHATKMQDFWVACIGNVPLVHWKVTSGALES